MELVRRFVPESFVEVIRDRLDRFNRRAVKRGLPPPALSLTGESERRDNNALWVEVILTGDIPRYDGWRLVASVDNVEGRAFFRPVPGETVPVQYRESDPSWCESCRTNRQRNETHIVAHDDGRTIQAGSTCIKDYLGWDVSALTYYWSFIDGFIEDDERLGGYAEPLFRPDDIVALAASVVSVDGRYIKTMYEEDSTKSKVFDFLYPTAYNKESRVHYLSQPELSKRIRAATYDAWSRLSDNEVTSSDWLYNIRTLMSASYIKTRQIGTIASVVILGLRAIEDEARRSSNPNRAHVGQVGGKYTGTLTVTDARVVESAWGSSYLFTMQDSDGNLFKWFASNEPVRGKRITEYIGLTFNIAGTIKKHDEYKGVKSTVLTRCKVEVAQ